MIARIYQNAGWMIFRSLATTVAGMVALMLVLPGLGVMNYGVYAAVTSVEGVVTFMLATFGETFRRSFGHELGKGVEGDLEGMAQASLGLSVLLAAVLLIIGETAGLACVKYVLIVPSECRPVAVFVYQCCMASAVFAVFQYPFVSLIASHERMDIFALTGILEATLVLLSACATVAVPASVRLQTYALAMLVTQAGMFACFYCFSQRVFPFHCRFRFSGAAFGAILSFFSWSIFRSASNVVRYRGSEMLLNQRVGVAFNSSWQAALRLSGYLNMFTENFQQAFAPQVLKRRQKEDSQPFWALVFDSTRLSFFLVWFFAFPILAFADEIGSSWFGTAQPPQFAAFLRTLVAYAVIESLASPLHVAITAERDVSRYQFVVSLLLASALPLACLAFGLTRAPWSVAVGLTAANGAALVYRTALVCRMRGFDVRSFVLRAVVPIAAVAVSAGLSTLIFGRLAGVAFSVLAILALKLFSMICYNHGK